MKRYIFALIALISLAGCTASSTNAKTYDYDVSCESGKTTSAFVDADQTADENGAIELIQCMNQPNFWMIRCKRETEQHVGNDTFCTTTDNKSARMTDGIK